MLDEKLIKTHAMQMPRMNRDICHGLATEQMKEVAEAIDTIWRDGAESFPKGLRYVDMTMATPHEAFREIVRQIKPKRTFDIAPSDLCLYKVRFTFEDEYGRVEELRPRYLSLPFVRDGNLFVLEGTQYRITPVYGGRIFSIEGDRVYMSSPRTRLCFLRENVCILKNSYITHTSVIHSKIYRPKKENAVTNRFSTLTHYMFAEFGVTETFKRYYNCNVKVGGEELDELIETGEWIVYASRKLKPKNLKMSDRDYTGCDLRIAIPAGEFSLAAESAVGAFYYSLDYFPEAMGVDDVDVPDLWLRLLSRFIFKADDSDYKRYDQMITHRGVVQQYMDRTTRRQLSLDGIPCDSIYDLFGYLTTHFNDMVLYNDVGSLYYQELSTVKHVMYDVIAMIFNLMFDLTTLSGDRLTAKKISQIMDRRLQRDKITGVTKHGEVTPDSSASDCKVFGPTANMVSQNSVSIATRGSTEYSLSPDDPGQQIHPSQIEVNSYSMMTKSTPTGRGKCNPYMQFGERWQIVPNPKLADRVENLSRLLKMH